MTCDLTCVLTGHREGRLSVASLRSFFTAIAFAHDKGYRVQVILTLDRPDGLTRDLFERAFAAHCAEDTGTDPALCVVDFGDQGLARNHAVTQAKGRYMAFLDADDLWSQDWLVQALAFLADLPETHIAHPAYNYFFEGQSMVFCHVDQLSPDFEIDTLRIANYWDALCVCPTAIYRTFPFGKRDIANGWAYEDWQWNCATVAAGYIHRVVPDSVLFKRRQVVSQTIRAFQNKSRVRDNPLADYSHPIYGGAR